MHPKLKDVVYFIDHFEMISKIYLISELIECNMYTLFRIYEKYFSFLEDKDEKYIATPQLSVI